MLLRPGRLEVDLGAVRTNFASLRRQVDTPVAAVVKADAYGHGAVEVARALEHERNCWGFCVANPQEGGELRQAGIRASVLVLSPGLAGCSASTARELARWLCEQRLQASLGGREEIRSWRAALAHSHGDEPVSVHVKVDTGMGRAGLSPGEVDRAVQTLSANRRFRIAGLFTHLAASEDLDRDLSEQQLVRFAAVVARLGDMLPNVSVHAANSAAALHRPASRLDLVRVGGALYGIDLAQRSCQATLTPAMRVVTRVVQTKHVACGAGVGYGHRWRAERESELALLPLGYADGLSAAGSGAEVLIDGQRVPAVGAVSMDQACADVTGLGVSTGCEVVVLGAQGNERITVFDHARWTGAPPYEVVCRFSRRLQRRFVGE